MDNTPRSFRAFISYSHADAEVAQWLHRALERYVVPAGLVGRTTPMGVVPRRLFPVFLDREEIPASSDLGQTIRVALAHSNCLIVICSPKAVRSQWVGEEIRSFKHLHGEARILGLIVGGEPNASDRPPIADQECFPRPFRYRVGPDGRLTEQRAEPVAPDIRPGHDPRRVALVRVIAGVLGVQYDDLRERDKVRRRRQLATTAAVVACVAGVVVSTVAVAVHKSRQAAGAVKTVQEQRGVVAAATQTAQAAGQDRQKAERARLLQGYVTDARQFPQQWAGDRIGDLRERLAAHVPAGPGREDPRGFEWYYWDRMAHGAAATLKAAGRVTSMAWSADARTLWYTDVTGRVVRWDVAAGGRADLRGPGAGAFLVAADAAGRRLAVATTANPPRDRPPGTHVDVLDPAGGRLSGFDDLAPVTSLALDADGSRVVTGDLAGEVTVWDAATGNARICLTNNPRTPRAAPLDPTRRLGVHEGPVTAVAFTPDGRRVVSGDFDGGLAVWDAVSGASFRPASAAGGGPSVAGIAFAADGARFVTRNVPSPESTGTGRVLVWATGAGFNDRPLAAVPISQDVRPARSGPMKAVPALGDVQAAFALGDGVVVTGVGNVLTVYDPGTAAVVDQRKGHVGPIVGVRAAADGRTVATADESGEINVWDLGAGNARPVQTPAKSPVRGLALAGPGGGVRAVLRDAGSFRDLHGASRPTSDLKLSLYADGKADDAPIPGGAAKGTPYGAAAASPAGRLFATAGGRLWEVDPASGKAVRSIGGAIGDESVRALACRGGDELFAVCKTSVRRLRLDAGVWEPVPQISAGTPPVFDFSTVDFKVSVGEDTVTSLAFSPDGRLAAAGDASGAIAVLAAPDWRRVQQLAGGHRREVTGLCFSPDGRRLVSCAGRFATGGLTLSNNIPGQVVVWDVATWRDCLTLTLPDDHVFAGVALTPDGRTLVAAANTLAADGKARPEGSIVAWDTSPPAPGLAKLPAVPALPGRAATVVAPKPPPAVASAAAATSRPTSRPASNPDPNVLAARTLYNASMAMLKMRVGFTSLAIHPSGDYAAAADVRGTVVLWDCRTGKIVRTASLDDSPDWRIAFCDGGAKLYCTQLPLGTETKYLTVPGMQEAEAPAGFDPPDSAALSTSQYASPDKKWELVLRKSKTEQEPTWYVYARDVSQKGGPAPTTAPAGPAAPAKPSTSPAPAAPPGPCAVEQRLQRALFFPDGEHFATMGAQNQIHVWSVRSPLPVAYWPAEESLDAAWKPKPPPAPTTQVAKAPPGKLPLVRALAGYPGPVGAIVFSADGRKVTAFASRGAGPRTAWDLGTGAADKPAKPAADVPAPLAVSPGGQWVYGSGQLVSAADGKARELPGAFGDVAVFSEDGQRVAVGGTPTRPAVYVYRTSDGTSVFDAEPSFPIESGNLALALSPDGKRLAAAGGVAPRRGAKHFGVQVWDLDAGRELPRPKWERGANLRVRFSPDGKQLCVTNEFFGDVGLYDVQTGKTVRSFAATADSPGRLGDAVAAGDDVWVMRWGKNLNAVTLWDVTKGRRLGQLDLGAAPSIPPAFSRDGGRALTVTPFGVTIWDTQSLAAAALTENLGTAVSATAFSPDGKRAAAGSVDGRVWVWDVP